MKKLFVLAVTAAVAGCAQTTPYASLPQHLERHMKYMLKDRSAVETVTPQPIDKVAAPLTAPVAPISEEKPSEPEQPADKVIAEEDRQRFKRLVMQDLRIKPPRRVFTPAPIKPAINQPSFCSGQCDNDGSGWTLDVQETPTAPHEGCAAVDGCAFTPAPEGGGTWYFGS